MNRWRICLSNTETEYKLRRRNLENVWDGNCYEAASPNIHPTDFTIFRNLRVADGDNVICKRKVGRNGMPLSGRVVWLAMIGGLAAITPMETVNTAASAK